MNNVGVSYPHAEYYESIDDQLIDDLIAINIQATNKVCLAESFSLTYPLLLLGRGRASRSILTLLQSDPCGGPSFAA